MADKVKFNIKNVHYAVYNAEDATWATPVAIPGAVNFSLEPQGDTSPFHADGIVYYQSTANNGYSGDLEVARFPDSFMTDVFGMVPGTTSKVLTENARTEPKAFALLFEEDGDVTGTKFVLYNCTATRPTRELATIEDTKEPQTQTSTITAIPMASGMVMAMAGDETPKAVLDDWYKTVYVEGATPPPANKGASK